MEDRDSQAARIEVECSFGAFAQAEPRRFQVGRAVYEILEVVDRWHQGPKKPSHPVRRYFKIRTRGDSLFLLAHEEGLNEWFLVKAFGPEIPVL